MTHLELRDVRRSYRTSTGQKSVLTGVSLAVAPGDRIALLGSSGSGKSTLLAILSLLDLDYAGDYVLDGANVRSLNRRAVAAVRAEHFSFVFQNYSLLPNLTCLENVVARLMVNPSVAPRERRRLALEALDALGIVDFRDSKPSSLSGGEQQRVALARAFAGSPRMIFADEPTGALDPVNRTRVMQILLDVSRARQTSVVVVTHDAAVADQMDVVYRMEAGRVVLDPNH